MFFELESYEVVTIHHYWQPYGQSDVYLKLKDDAHILNGQYIRSDNPHNVYSTFILNKNGYLEPKTYRMFKFILLKTEEIPIIKLEFSSMHQ